MVFAACPLIGEDGGTEAVGGGGVPLGQAHQVATAMQNNAMALATKMTRRKFLGAGSGADTPTKGIDALCQRSSRIWSRTTREMQIPPGSANASSRAAMLTPSP